MSATSGAGRRNRLAGETSPYLLQHAGNPVDWYPWGEEAFALARAEDRPILLSVGYSSCHWCHVMAHESFEDPAIAALMNQWFVNIKVDREERPDVDAVYMTAVQALTGQGGWPMTVFLTPELKPFYAGTYFPPDDRSGRPGFPRVLEALHESWLNERERLLSSADGIVDHLKAASTRIGLSGASTAPVTPELAEQAVQGFRSSFDPTWGGFGGAPKFPSPPNLEFLLAHAARTGSSGPGPAASEMALLTLVRMASGGMYDHLGGGFARYSVDDRWLIPHFEKMLYDNAQLARVYLHAYQLTGDAFYERIVRETLDYLARDMRDPDGGFYAAQDADSEGLEGKYYVWTPTQVAEVLDEEDAAVFNDWFGVTAEGNFRDPHHPELTGRSALSTWRDVAAVAARHGLTAGQLDERLAGMQARMLSARRQRVPPGLDDKALTSWNGLALAAFAEAGRVLGDPRYLDLARQNAAFVRTRLWSGGRLRHTWKAGQAKVAGMLEDYAYYGLGLVELYRATGDLDHLAWARELIERLLSDFADASAPGFFETAADGEELLLRQQPFFDAATPSGNGAAALLAFWLGRYYGRPDWEELAAGIVARVREHLTSAPTGFGTFLQLAELLLAPRQELAIVGEPEVRAPLEAEAARHFRPWLVLAPADDAGGLPLLEDRPAPPGGAAAYLCHDMACEIPVHTANDLRVQLRAG